MPEKELATCSKTCRRVTRSRSAASSIRILVTMLLTWQSLPACHYQTASLACWHSTVSLPACHTRRVASGILGNAGDEKVAPIFRSSRGTAEEFSTGRSRRHHRSKLEHGDKVTP